jgi:hypothetical protein
LLAWLFRSGLKEREELACIPHPFRPLTSAVLRR